MLQQLKKFNQSNLHALQLVISQAQFYNHCFCLSQEMAKVKHEQEHEDSASQSQGPEDQNPELQNLRQWMEKVEPIKLIKLSENLMTSLLEGWSKFRITVLKTINEQENKVLDCMARVRKEVQWLNQVKMGGMPELNKFTSRLFAECRKMHEKGIKFQLGEMLKQSGVITDKMLDNAKNVYQSFKQKLNQLLQQYKSVSSVTELLVERTYFRFLQKQHNADIDLISETTATCVHDAHEINLGAVMGPSLTKNNFKFGVLISKNDLYHSYIGVGVCHPNIVKQNSYNQAGIDSGCYIIRQDGDASCNAVSLSHAYGKEGTSSRHRDVGWGFGQGDEILVELDYKKGTVSFSRGDHYYEMRVDLSQGPISPYVTLYSKWDCICILNA